MAKKDQQYRNCGLVPEPPPAVASESLGSDRLGAILTGLSKWANGTVIHYYFFDDKERDGSRVRLEDGSSKFVTWVGPEKQQNAVREAFRVWEQVGIGLRFQEVDDRSEAEVRIGFLFDYDGSWSALGRGVLQFGPNSRTMNFGWDLTTQHGRATALHEIGHTLGMPHEHQNPFAGIVWDEPKVYQYFQGPPNRWDREKTFHNVLRKLDTGTVTGSEWDPTSIMEYGFPAGLILEPAQFQQGVRSPLALSATDQEYVRQWYPTVEAVPASLQPHRSELLELRSGEQADFSVTPPGTRKYEFGVFGAADTNVVLFEKVGAELRFLAGQDDVGDEQRKPPLQVKLFKEREYVLRVRLLYTDAVGASVMYW